MKGSNRGGRRPDWQVQELVGTCRLMIFAKTIWALKTIWAFGACGSRNLACRQLSGQRFIHLIIILFKELSSFCKLCTCINCYGSHWLTNLSIIRLMNRLVMVYYADNLNISIYFIYHNLMYHNLFIIYYVMVILMVISTYFNSIIQ